MGWCGQSFGYPLLRVLVKVFNGFATKSAFSPEAISHA